MDDLDLDSELRKVRGEAQEHFVLWHETVSISAVAALVGGIRPPYSEVGSAFLQNLNALVQTVSLPFTLAIADAQSRHFQRFLTAERIRSLGIGDEASDGDEAVERRRHEHAMRIASERMEEFGHSDNGTKTMAIDSFGFLLRALKSGDLSTPAAELLRQATVLAWSAFEVLCRDVFVAYLNEIPSAVGLLVETAASKRRFDGSKIPLEVLREHDFDLSAKMGDILASQQDFSDLPTIKAALLAVFPASDTLSRTIADPDLWLLSQRRHLVVHRRAVVDRRYIEKTGESLDVGMQLVVTPKGLRTHLRTVVTVGIALLNAVPNVGNATVDREPVADGGS